MMTKQIWLNLPVKNLVKAKDFFLKIGFSFKEEYDTPKSACLIIGERNFVVMLFEENLFKTLSQNKLANTQSSSEMLISIDAESRDEVDQLAKKVKEAGGKIFSPPAESEGWIYSFGFSDIDGHRWNSLFMDFSKLSEKK
jgi:predicted lactoylglutathione lyase